MGSQLPVLDAENSSIGAYAWKECKLPKETATITECLLSLTVPHTAQWSHAGAAPQFGQSSVPGTAFFQLSEVMMTAGIMTVVVVTVAATAAVGSN